MEKKLLSIGFVALLNDNSRAFRHSFLKQLFVAFLLLSSIGVWGQTTLAAWTFPTTTGNAPATLPAECGVFSTTSNLYADGTNGSSNWSAAATRQYFAGDVPASALCSVITQTGAYSLVSPVSPFNNNFSVVYKISTIGYQDIILTYATRGTATGYSVHDWSYSTDGITFTAYSKITGRNSTTFSTQTVDFSAISGLNNLANVYIKLTVSGATASGANNRLDNINFSAAPISTCSTPADPSGTITATPACGSTNLSFSGTAPTGVTYFWQTTATGTSTIYPTTGAYAPTVAGTYHVRAKSDAGNCWSTGTVSQAITVVAAPSISIQPTNQTVTEPSTATFSVTAANATSYQWQVDTGSGFNDISGANSATYTTPATTVAMGGYQYKVIVTGSTPCAPIESAVKTLTVNGVVPPVISSSLTRSTVYGTGDSYTITASGSPTYSTGPLPTGFTFAGATITKANNADAATYNISISATNGGGTVTKNLVWTVTAKPLTISGITGDNKVYDGGTIATLSGSATLNGIVGSDDVSLSGTASGAFADKNAGTTKTVNITGLSLTGTKAGNYSLPTAPNATTTADISKKALTITAPSIATKVYDTFPASGAVTPGTLSGFVGTETVIATATGTYADANAGSGKTANITYTLTNGANGGLAANYSLANGTGTGDITKAPTVITPSTINVSTNGTYILPGTAFTTNNPDGAITYSLTSNGYATLSGNTITAGATVGAETLTVKQAMGTNYLQATDTTVGVNVTTIVYNDGDWKSTSAGTWSSTASGSTVTWSKRVGGVWTPQTLPTQAPTAGGANRVYIYTDVVLAGNNTAKDLVIGVDPTNVTKIGVLHATINTTFGKLIVEDGGTFSKEANGVGIDAEAIGGILEVKDGGTFLYKHTAAASSAIWAAKEMFHANSIFKVVTVNSSTMLVIPNVNDVSAYTDSTAGTTACFGNIIIDCSTGKMNLVPDGFNLQLTAKDLIFRNNSDTTPLSTGDITTTIGGNLIIENTYSVNAINFASTASNINITVKGDFIHNGTKAIRPTTNLAANSIFTIEGNLSVSNGGSFIMNGTAGALTGTSIANLKGNLSVSSTSTINSTATGNNNFNFTGSATQTIDVANAATASNIIFNANTGSYVKLINQNFALGANSKFNVLNGATLDFGFNTSNAALNILGTTGTTFTASPGSTLKITSPYGITTAVASATAGNVQTLARNFATGGVYGDYYFIGNAPQSTGDALPANVRNLIINNTANTNEVTLNNASLNVTTSLDIQNGIFNLNDKATTGTSSATLNIEGLATLKIAGTQTFPSGFTGANKITFKPTSIVEYGGVAAQSIANTAAIGYTNLPAYQTLKVSGSNIKTASGTTTVNEKTKITSNGATLLVPAYDPTASTPVYSVFNATLGIENSSPANVASAFILGNDANLMQDASAINIGNITVERNATIPVSTFNQYTYWGSPVIGLDFKNIFPGNPTSALYHNESNNKFYTSSGVYIAGRGLAVRNPFIASGSPTIQTASLKGTPYNSDLNYNLNFTDALHGYNLVGNPYPSNLDLNLLYSHSTNIASTFLFWDNTYNSEQTQLGNTYTGDSYAKYNAAAGDTGTGIPAPGSGTAASNGSKVPNNILKVGQGFMVKAKSSGASVGFKTADRITTQTASQFFGKSGTAVVNDRYLLEFVTPTALVFSNALVYFENGNSNYAEDDTKFESSVSEGLFTQAGDEKVVINGRSPFVNTDIVKVGSRNFATGLYEIRLGTKEGVFANGQNIYLKDKQNGIITNLSQGSYSFAANAGESTGRFEIVYVPDAVLATDAKVKESLIVYRDGNDFVVKAQSKKISSLEVFDTAGRLILALNPNSIKAVIPSEKLLNGVYVLKINQNGELTSKKIIR